MSQIPPLTIRGNARNNYLYGTAISDGINAGLGDDYLRGYAGNDYLWGGAGSDRFVFERTQTQNGLDTIKDYMYAPAVGGGEVDVLDFSLVGFARNALSRNGAIENGIDNVVRFVDDGIGGGARVEVSLTGAGGETYTEWATLEGLYAGNLVHFRIGAHTYTRPVQGTPSTGLRYDIGNGDRNGDGAVMDGEDEYLNDFADDDDLFDDRLIVGIEGGDYNDTIHMGADVLMGDRVVGFGGTTAFTPGVTALRLPENVTDSGDDAVDDGQFEVYYGTYDAATDIFTVTSTPDTTADPTRATHTMVLYDSDGDSESGDVGSLGGMVLQGVYAENQWYLDDAGRLHYATDAVEPGNELPWLGDENVLYGTNDREFFDGGDGIDIIYAGGGSDFLFGGASLDNKGRDMGPRPDGNDWLYGGGGADAFFATNVVEGGIDSIKDFSDNGGAANTSDVIVLVQEAGLASHFFEIFRNTDTPSIPDGVVVTNLVVAQMGDEGGLFDLGDLTVDPDESLDEMMVQANGVRWGAPDDLSGEYNVYRFRYDGKEYLFWDAWGDGYAGEAPVDALPQGFDDVVVEITGAAGLNASNIVLLQQGLI
ncbi:hypothetical protein J8G26_03450 [Acidovorax sp. JG5]|uniref:hypothetical protein n=1 Tax=Acidovorax sp. JG5 TaxID=2822718 RepID=UPI001B33F565|nr:hypothetical protein [Acidovorax sp. JG5]MBP3979789.1 hypothetical protein [Acidovorax sp. JG5]